MFDLFVWPIRRGFAYFVPRSSSFKRKPWDMKHISTFVRPGTFSNLKPYFRIKCILWLEKAFFALKLFKVIDHGRTRSYWNKRHSLPIDKQHITESLRSLLQKQDDIRAHSIEWILLEIEKLVIHLCASILESRRVSAQWISTKKRIGGKLFNLAKISTASLIKTIVKIMKICQPPLCFGVINWWW